MVKIDYLPEEAIVLARVEGELDMQAAPGFRAAIDTAVDSHRAKRLLLDFRKVSFIDSSGLGVILGRYKKLAQSGGRIAIAGAKPQVRRVLELSGVMRIIDVFETEAKALQKM
ncbi:MAG: STAS domain-containing protein [bacterium]